MIDFERRQDIYHTEVAKAESQFGQAIQIDTLSPRMPNSETLSVLTDSRPAQSDFMPIPIDVKDYPRSAILGSILLLQNPVDKVMHPAMIIQDPHKPAVVRLSKLNQPFVPTIGITDGINFALSVEKQTQQSSFGGHGASGAFEGGHFGTGLASGASDGVSQRLAQAGDHATHEFLEPGLPTQYKALGLVPGDAIPTIASIDTSRYRPGQRFPLYWHPALEHEYGAATPTMNDAARLLLGAAVHALGQAGLDRAKRNIGNVIRGAQVI